MEIWVDIPRFNGLYQASNLGKIKSIARKAGSRWIDETILKPIQKNDGYMCINITYPKRRQYLVHRIICETFLPTIEEKNLVNHKDFDRSNNKVENLEWCTHMENVIHYLEDQRGQGRLLLNYETGIFYFNATEAGDTIGVSRDVIYNNLSPSKSKFKKNGNRTPFVYV